MGKWRVENKEGQILGMVQATDWGEAVASADRLPDLPAHLAVEKVETPGGRFIYQWPQPMARRNRRR